MTQADVFPVHPAPPPEAVPPVGHRLEPADRPDRDTCLRLWRTMLLTRSLEERVIELYRQGAITGGVYTAIGNEATSVGTAWALEPRDVLVPTQRDLGSHLVHGHGPLEVMRQYLKRATSQTGGKDSSLHLGREGTNVVGMISHLAHMLPVATGVALAERIKGNDVAVLTSVGDGATSLGDFHEALNFAAVQKLPVIFVIVNNQYAYSTPPSLQYACERLSDRAVGYGIAGEQVDGTDVLEVVAASRRAIRRARDGQGPTLLEAVTMRMRGHSEHDDFRYVPPALVERWRRWDPIARMARHLAEQGFADDTALEALRADVRREIDAAAEVALAEPPPDPASAGHDVYRHWSPEWDVPSGESWELAR